MLSQPGRRKRPAESAATSSSRPGTEYKIRFAHTARGIYAANFSNPEFHLDELKQPLKLYRISRGGGEKVKQELDPEIAPSAKRTTQPFQKKTKIVYKRDDPKVIRDRLQWSLEDANGKKYVGRPQGGIATGRYVMFMHDGNGFKVVPVRKWLNFSSNTEWPESDEEDKMGDVSEDIKFVPKKEQDEGVASLRKTMVKVVKDSASDNEEAGSDDEKKPVRRSRDIDEGNEEEMDFEEQVDDDVAEDEEETKSNTKVKYGVAESKKPGLSMSGKELTKIFRDIKTVEKGKQQQQQSKSKKPAEDDEDKKKAKGKEKDTEAATSPPATSPSTTSIVSPPPSSSSSSVDPSKKRQTSYEDQPMKKVKTEAASSPASPVSPAAARAAENTLLTDMEVRTFLQTARPTSKDVLIKFEPRLRQNKKNKELLKEIVQRIAKIVPENNQKVVVLKTVNNSS